MRSVVLDDLKTNQCGICGSKEPFIEYKKLEGVHFIWCKKCHTITFFKQPQSEEKKAQLTASINEAISSPTSKEQLSKEGFTDNEAVAFLA